MEIIAQLMKNAYQTGAEKEFAMETWKMMIIAMLMTTAKA